MEAGDSLTCLISDTRFAVRTCSSDCISPNEMTWLSGIGRPRSASFAYLRPRSKNASTGSTRISVFFMIHLPHQTDPLFLKPRFEVFEALELNCRYLTLIVTVMPAVRRIVAKHPAVIARIESMV